jgi:hypothetical protein
MPVSGATAAEPVELFDNVLVFIESDRRPI